MHANEGRFKKCAATMNGDRETRETSDAIPGMQLWHQMKDRYLPNVCSDILYYGQIFAGPMDRRSAFVHFFLLYLWYHGKLAA
mmetsp:Transcript_77508/g.136718  ORF Transcript_77508/g.136718 Transcript_77508/m.136718 type:complete len:83 (-) Transcript_77508:1512-1760(-)